MKHDEPALDDWGVLETAAGGDHAAFEDLIARYHALLRCIIVRRGSLLLRYADLQEIIDETWYQVLRRALAGRLRPSVRFSHWLSGVCLNVLKQKGFRPSPARLDPMAAEGSSLLAGTGEPPDEVVAREELLAALADCLDERPARERQVYELIYAAGHSKVAAARELGCSEAYVRQKLLPRLHAALAQCLAQKGFREAESIAEGAS